METKSINQLLGASGILFSACYSIFLYNRFSYGNISPYLPHLKDLNRREFFLLVTLLLPMVIFGILPNILLDSLHLSTTALISEFPPLITDPLTLNLNLKDPLT
jgi:NADH-ubiquinone oxidoreductase chain 4